MNCAHRLTHVVALASLCAVVHAFAAKSTLRFDGFYRCNVPTNIGAMTSYLRFYPDGMVVATTSPGTLGDVTKWLNRQQKPNFHYSIRGNSIQFTEDRGGALSYVYSGPIGTDSLTLRVGGTTINSLWDMFSGRTSSFTLLLCHEISIIDSSNQALERTAARRVFTFSDD